MSVSIKDNSNAIKQRMKIKGNIFLRSMADEVVKISTPKTPKKDGNLRRDVLKSVLGLQGKIEWRKNYAAFQEVKQYRNYTTPGTGPHYAENAVKDAVKRTRAVARRVGLI